MQTEQILRFSKHSAFKVNIALTGKIAYKINLNIAYKINLNIF